MKFGIADPLNPWEILRKEMHRDMTETKAHEYRRVHDLRWGGHGLDWLQAEKVAGPGPVVMQPAEEPARRHATDHLFVPRNMLDPQSQAPAAVGKLLGRLVPRIESGSEGLGIARVNFRSRELVKFWFHVFVKSLPQTAPEMDRTPLRPVW